MIISFKVLEIQYSPDLKSRWGLVFLLNILYVQDVTVLTPKKINNKKIKFGFEFVNDENEVCISLNMSFYFVILLLGE